MMYVFHAISTGVQLMVCTPRSKLSMKLAKQQSVLLDANTAVEGYGLTSGEDSGKSLVGTAAVLSQRCMFHVCLYAMLTIYRSTGALLAKRQKLNPIAVTMEEFSADIIQSSGATRLIAQACADVRRFDG